MTRRALPQRIPKRLPGAARALILLTAAGLLLSGCHAHRAAHHGRDAKHRHAPPRHHRHPW